MMYCTNQCKRPFLFTLRYPFLSALTSELRANLEGGCMAEWPFDCAATLALTHTTPFRCHRGQIASLLFAMSRMTAARGNPASAVIWEQASRLYWIGLIAGPIEADGGTWQLHQHGARVID